MKQTPVHFDISKLKPVVNEVGFDLHYNGIYKKHVDNFNEAQGDIAFEKAGAFLHQLYFDNIRDFRTNNQPIGKVAQIIDTRYGSYENFTKTLFDQVDRIQGNGWVFMNSAGYINIIPNNRIVDNVALIIDCWEHAYAFAHGINRRAYIHNHLGIIDWEVVNQRIFEINNKKRSED